MKKFIYLFLSVILWLMLSLLVYIFLEGVIIYLLINIFPLYLKISYTVFTYLRVIFIILFLILGFFTGISVGKKWWKFIYIDKRRKRKFFKLKKL